MPLFTLAQHASPFINLSDDLLTPVRNAQALQDLETAATQDPSAKLADVYDDSPDLRAALAVLLPGFEYPDHSHKTLAALLKSAKAQAASEYLLNWRPADGTRWYQKSFRVDSPLKAVAAMERHLANRGPVVVDHLAHEVTGIESDGLKLVTPWSLLALPAPRSFNLEFSGHVVARTAELRPA